MQDSQTTVSGDVPLYLDPSASFEARAADLVARMTLDEKISQTWNSAPAIERLGIPRYNWWNECLHGIGRAGIATVFPQAIGLAATWNAPLMHQIATVIADEGRAKHHEAVRQDRRGWYEGLTFWTPNINIFRDPRWGRGQETYGEDPYLTARFGVAMVRGLQGDHERYLKLAACAKHLAVHSGPEDLRHGFDARVSAYDLWDTYLPAFEALVREGRVESVMGAYTRVNGEPCCASPMLMAALRDWGFDGHFVSDCGALDDLYREGGHGVAATVEEAAALAIRTGCDLNCGDTYKNLRSAVEQGLVDEAAIDAAVIRLMRTRLRLGMFDPPESVPYTAIPIEINDSPAHHALARRAAQEAIVLLKNNGVLPLPKAGPTLRTLAVIGPNADDVNVLLGNYNGTPSVTVTPLGGIREALGAAVQVEYAAGCRIAGSDTRGYAEALALAERADAVIFVGGLSMLLEGEEGEYKYHFGESEDVPPTADRVGISLPSVQENLLKALVGTGKPVILVLLNGGPVSVPWAEEHVAAIVEAWYPGQFGGAALADVLFGDYNPAGRLPVTVYRSTDDLPPFEDYAMANRTYRYFRGAPLYRFGFGLSYTRFTYRELALPETFRAEADSALDVTVMLENTGGRDGDEVVQLYLRPPQKHGESAPLHYLAGFARVHRKAGEREPMTIRLDTARLQQVGPDGTRRIVPGRYQVFVGPVSPSADAESTYPGLVGTLQVV